MDGIELVVLDNWLAVLGNSIFNQIEKKKTGYHPGCYFHG